MTQIKLDASKKSFFMQVPGTRMVIVGWVLALLALIGSGSGSPMSPAVFVGGIVLMSAGHAIRTFSKNRLS